MSMNKIKKAGKRLQTGASGDQAAINDLVANMIIHSNSISENLPTLFNRSPNQHRQESHQSYSNDSLNSYYHRQHSSQYSSSQAQLQSMTNGSTLPTTTTTTIHSELHDSSSIFAKRKTSNTHSQQHQQYHHQNSHHRSHHHNHSSQTSLPSETTTPPTKPMTSMLNDPMLIHPATSSHTTTVAQTTTTTKQNQPQNRWIQLNPPVVVPLRQQRSTSISGVSHPVSCPGTSTSNDSSNVASLTASPSLSLSTNRNHPLPPPYNAAIAPTLANTTNTTRQNGLQHQMFSHNVICHQPTNAQQVPSTIGSLSELRTVAHQHNHAIGSRFSTNDINHAPTTSHRINPQVQNPASSLNQAPPSCTNACTAANPNNNQFAVIRQQQNTIPPATIPTSTSNNFIFTSQHQQYPFPHNHHYQHHPHNAHVNSQEVSAAAAVAALANGCLQFTDRDGYPPKKSCLTCADISIKWYIVVIALLGLICALIGTIVGAVHSAGRDYISLTLLLIGVGLVLVAIIWVALRITIKTYKGSLAAPILPNSLHRHRAATATAARSSNINRPARTSRGGRFRGVTTTPTSTGFLALPPQLARLLGSVPSTSSGSSSSTTCPTSTNMPPGNGTNQLHIQTLQRHSTALLNERLCIVAAAAVSSTSAGNNTCIQSNNLMTTTNCNQSTTADNSQNQNDARTTNATRTMTPDTAHATNANSSGPGSQQQRVRQMMSSLKERLPGRLARLMTAYRNSNNNNNNNNSSSSSDLTAEQRDQAAAVTAAAALIHQYQQQLQRNQFLFPPGPGGPHYHHHAHHQHHLANFGLTDYGNFRPPPPSYSASMQEQRLRMLMQERASLQQLHAMNMFPSVNQAPPPPPPSIASSESNRPSTGAGLGNQSNRTATDEQIPSQTTSSTGLNSTSFDVNPGRPAQEEEQKEEEEAVIIQNPINRRPLEVPRASVGRSQTNLEAHQSTTAPPAESRRRLSLSTPPPPSAQQTSSDEKAPAARAKVAYVSQEATKTIQSGTRGDNHQSRGAQVTSTSGQQLKLSSSSPTISNQVAGCFVNNDMYISSATSSSSSSSITNVAACQIGAENPTNRQTVRSQTSVVNITSTVSGEQASKQLKRGHRKPATELKILGYL